MKQALIFGANGQDGSYMAQLLLRKGYRVIAGVRPNSSKPNFRHHFLGISEELEFVEIDLNDLARVFGLIKEGSFDEIYNFAAQSSVGNSWEHPLDATMTAGVGAHYLLEAVRLWSPRSKVFLASSAEILGNARAHHSENVRIHVPNSPYGVAKQYAHAMTCNYRKGSGIFACSGIFFNHESPLRPREFVTRKITSQLAEIKCGGQDVLKLGNLSSERDWGYAKEFMEAAWLMLQQSEPDDFEIGTGVVATVRQFTSMVAKKLDMDLVWQGEGVDEVAYERASGRLVVQVEPLFFRPLETHTMIANPTKAREKLNWTASTHFEELAGIMAAFDLAEIQGSK